ncbi:MAG: hypothetical protein ACFFDH_13400 [Promethearchaeota archaeon]
MKKGEKRIKYRAFPWIKFFIILFSTISVCLLFIPYSESKVIGDSLTSSNTIIYLEYPWRSFSQEIFLNATVTEGNITLQIIDTEALINLIRDQTYVPYWEITNVTDLITNIEISPPDYYPMYILVSAEGEFSFSLEIEVSYLNYASNYGFFFLGVAIILISFYLFCRYKLRIYL